MSQKLRRASRRRLPDILLRRSQRDQDYADNKKHAHTDEFLASDDFFIRLRSHHHGVSKARPCSYLLDLDSTVDT